MVFSATFNNDSVISWRSVLLVEETGVPGENHRHVAIKTIKLAVFIIGVLQYAVAADCLLYIDEY